MCLVRGVMLDQHNIYLLIFRQDVLNVDEDVYIKQLISNILIALNM